MSIIEKFFDFIAGRSGYRETYISDSTRFIREYLATHPEEIESQKRGRAIWWDKTLDERGPVPPMQPTPKAGGNEATFVATDTHE